ncbi:sulfatase-like hydrolase/transferase [bacterium]|nr:sulfatase-like hydrolase/transferase [bacterium]
MNRFMLGVCAWLLGGFCCLPLSAAERPNILILFADDLGYSDLGCYGSEIDTPHLDRLAQNGLRFTQFYNTARCWPSRAALLTGYYAQQVRRDSLPGVPSGSRGIRQPWAKLLPELLKPAGYHSYHSGKWHVDGPRIASGFEHSYSLEDHNHFFNPQQHLEDDVPLPPVPKGANEYVTITIVDHAIRCLQDHAKQHAGQPFCSYVAFTAPHFPLQALPDDIAKYQERYRQGWDKTRAARYQRQREMGLVTAELSAREEDIGPPYDFPEDIKKLGPGEINRPLAWDALTSEQQEFQTNKMAIHAAMVDRMDQEIGRILAQVEAMQATEDTLVMFLSDNGASAEIMVRGDGHDQTAAPGSAATFLCLGPGWSTSSNTPFRRHKTWVHEGGISTPFIVTWPRGIAARGELRSTPGHIIDVVPTLLDVAGVNAKAEDSQVPARPGISLVKEFAEAGSVSHDSLWWLHEGNRAIRMGDWKLVAAKDQPWELYDLSQDRSEQHNLAAGKPELVRELATLWDAQTAEYLKHALLDPAPEPSRPANGKKAKKKAD